MTGREGEDPGGKGVDRVPVYRLGRTFSGTTRTGSTPSTTEPPWFETASSYGLSSCYSPMRSSNLGSGYSSPGPRSGSTSTQGTTLRHDPEGGEGGL